MPDLICTDPEHIAISKSKGIKIDWKDGHASDYELQYLRGQGLGIGGLQRIHDRMRHLG